MGFFDRFRTTDTKQAARSDPKDTTELSVDPLVVAPVNIIGGRIEDFNALRSKNRYAMADNLLRYDERLFSAVELMALMIKKSISDISIALKQDDRLLTNEEENAVKVANQFAKKIHLKELFRTYTIDLWKYGDAVDVIHFDGSGVTSLEPLPMGSVTAVDKRSQLNQAINFNDPMIKNPKWYALDEQLTFPDVPNQVFKKDRILHISFNPRRNMIRDNLGRWTINVWSTAPITSLIAILQWKQILIRNNILWSNRSVPREHHILDLSQFDISKFSGEFASRQSQSIAAAEKAIKAYNENIQRREADQGYVTGQGVAIEYIEPKSRATDDMPILSQINELLNGPTGTPSSLMGGETKGFTSLVHSASFLALRAESYAEVIQTQLEKLIKRHVKIARPGIRAEVVDRLFIKNRLILDRDRAELAKIIAVLVESGTFTVDEIRHIWGLDPMTEIQMKEHLKWIKDVTKAEAGPQPQNKGNQRSEDMLRRTGVNPTGDQESSAKRQAELSQKGKGKSPRSPIR